jgi:poly(beta-D-mannuronate) C5 epimerase
VVLARTAFATLAGACLALAGAAASAAAPAGGGVQPASLQQPSGVGRYVVRKVDSANLWIEPPQLPDLQQYNDAAIEGRIPQGPKGRADVRRMVDMPTLHEFVAGQGGRLGEWAARQHTNPQAIVIEGGVMTPKDLAKALGEKFEETEPGVFVARLPIVVQPGATLHVDKATKELRLSQERGAFLVNDGLTFITHTRVTGWKESQKAPAKFQSASEFRPFIVSWGGAQFYALKTVFTSMGYEASKSFGLSLSQYSPNMDAQLKRKPASGWAVQSEFNDFYYGFYCYEAKDVVLLGNTYKDSVVYGIDPHDRSERLIIARNTVQGTKKKHGIIVSRAVNDSWILWNKVVGNALSGIVLDRNSVRNVVAYNDVFNNGADGITIYESPNNLVWNNRASSNRQHGIRLRNSIDVRLYGNMAVANRLSGVYGHVKDLRGTDRDIKLDPYEPSISLVVVGGQLIFNGSGPLAIDKPLSVELYGVDLLAPTKKAGIQLAGLLGEHQHEILDILVRQRGAVVIEPAVKAAANVADADGEPADAKPADASPPAAEPDEPVPAADADGARQP